MRALVAWKNSRRRKPLVVRGARQVGKTYLLKDFGASEFPNAHYVNFEEDDKLALLFGHDLRPRRILDELQFHVGKRIDAQADLVVFDEIQRCPRALTSLKYFCEEMPRLAVCAAGSLLGVCMGQEAFPVGKVAFLDLWPMSFEEFIEGIGESQLAHLLASHDPRRPYPEAAHERLWILWKQYLVVGGLPEAVNTYRLHRDNMFAAMEEARRCQRDLVDTYMADIARHSGKMNALHIERLWRHVPAQLARAQDGSAPKFRFRDALPGMRGYERLSGPIGWLESAALVLRVAVLDSVATPLSSVAKDNAFKLYLFDVGILGALGGIAPKTILDYGFGSYQGYVAENFVAQELCAAGFKHPYSWQGRTSEVEFLVETGKSIVPLEVKSGMVTKSKSLGVYERLHHPSQAWLLSARNSARHGIRQHAPLYAAGRMCDHIGTTSQSQGTAR